MSSEAFVAAIEKVAIATIDIAALCDLQNNFEARLVAIA